MALFRRKTRSRTKPVQPTVGGQLHRIRMRILLWAFLGAYAVIGGRLVQLQLEPDLKLTEQELAHIGEKKIYIPRGTIYDRNGERPLATDRKVKSLTVDPSGIAELSENDPQAVAKLARHLADVLELDPQQVTERLTQLRPDGTPMLFAYVKRWLSPEEVTAVGDLANLPLGDALQYDEEPIRFYPERDLAAHVLGFANRESEGSEGIELAYDRYLKSTAGIRKTRVDRRRQALRVLEYEAPSGGNDVILTIDAEIQHRLEEEIDAALADKHATKGMGIVMDVHTGAVLAMANRPAFDPNKYTDYPPELRKNRAATDIFEPGSAFKIVTAVAALESGLVTADTRIDCEKGTFYPYGVRVEDDHKLDIAPFSACFAYSSNIAMIKVAALLGPERFSEWVQRMGFARRTSPEFLGESAGMFTANTSKWSRISMRSLPMGYEVGVTMPQLARAYAAVANGGYLVEPYLVERVMNRDGGTVYTHGLAKRERIFSAKTAETMRRLCHLVVTEPGATGRRANIPEYRVGGKTGTAFMVRPEGGYYKDKYRAVFAGFAPVGDPKLCAVVVIDEPEKGKHYGGLAAAPVFKAVMKDALVLLNCPEDPVVLTNQEPEVALETIAEKVAELDVEFMDPSLESLEVALDGLELVAYSKSSVGVSACLPSFIGLTKRQALSRLGTLKLRWDAQGYGRVVAQEPPAGTPLQEVKLCSLVFAREEAAQENDPS